MAKAYARKFIRCHSFDVEVEGLSNNGFSRVEGLGKKSIGDRNKKVVLWRGFDKNDLFFVEWFDESPRSEKKITVRTNGRDGGVKWTLHNAKIINRKFSDLDAVQEGVLEEVITLKCETIDEEYFDEKEKSKDADGRSA